jgi:hypothetical protein
LIRGPTMLNARLYRTSWLVAGVALIVALLTLQSPSASPEPPLPPSADGQQALATSLNLALVGQRTPGSAADAEAADAVARSLASLPGGRASDGSSRVRRQSFVAWADGSSYRLTNVYLAVPASSATPEPSGVLVVAPRDTPPGVRGAATGTGLLVELARLATSSTHRRPLLFVSTDGSTLGNAGIRWFLSRFSAFPITAALVLDGPGDARGSTVQVWDAARAPRQALGLASWASDAAERSGAKAALDDGLVSQSMRMAVPQAFGDQGPIVAAGIPAVTLSGRTESPLPPRRPGPTAARMTLVGNMAEGLLGSIDVADEAPAPESSLVLAGKTLRPSIARIVLLLLALPVLVAAVDALARLRRARVPVLPGLRAVGWRMLPLLAALAAGHILSLLGVLPGTSAGAPPLPGAVPFDALAAVGLIVMAAVAVLVARVGRRRVSALAARLPEGSAPAPAEASAALVALAALIVLAWFLLPFSLVLALPAAHAALVATVVPRRWQALALAVVAALPVLVLCVVIGDVLDRNLLYAAWYLLATAAAGARGFWGPALFAAFVATVWSVASLVAFRARKGLVRGGRVRPSRPEAR